ncbi:malate transporter [Photobacterium gaetbulicola]|uniref:Malate transporter n=1 Tax=Photobacterium gaetbulicola TaxID=1295392 RepID=A0A0B9G4G5_9GAMM|nr:malate transporter [Photobacterium gaetbulicola]
MFISLLMALSTMAAAESESGLDIASEMLARDAGYVSYISDVEMLIIAANGDTVRRQLTIKGIEQENDGDKIITYFQAPRDIAGTALLTYSHAIEADDQWLFLPSIKRVKRISSNNRSGPFMGSEFAYEDMSSWELDKYRYELVKEKTQNEKTYWLLACFPRYENSGYSKLIAWIDQDIYQPRKIEYYDRKGELFKQLTLSQYELHNQRYWRPKFAQMDNLQNNRSSSLTWKNMTLDVDIPQAQFEPKQLRNAYRYN